MKAIRGNLLIFLALAASAGSARAAGVVGVGNFSHIVSDIERAAAFYAEVLELVPGRAPTEFSPNPAIMRLGATPGAQSRIATFSIPGSELGVELIEYKDIARGHAQIQFQDPGAAVLQLRVRDPNNLYLELMPAP
jgi:catechol 2,3-dioxygenase-like lactoylglutathione lyase family enzyme